jgi:hypothetical protein
MQSTKLQANNGASAGTLLSLIKFLSDGIHFKVPTLRRQRKINSSSPRTKWTEGTGGSPSDTLRRKAGKKSRQENQFGSLMEMRMREIKVAWIFQQRIGASHSPSPANAKRPSTTL